MSADREKLDTYEKWKLRAIKLYEDEECHWKTIGDWAYPTKENVLYREVFEHLCLQQMKADGHKGTYYAFDKCTHCEEKVPDNLKMIALLELL